MESLKKFGVNVISDNKSSTISFKNDSFIVIERGTVKISGTSKQKKNKGTVKVFRSELIYNLNWEVTNDIYIKNSCDCGKCGTVQECSLKLSAFSDNGNFISMMSFIFLLENNHSVDIENSDNNLDERNNELINFSNIITFIKSEIKRLESKKEVIFE